VRIDATVVAELRRLVPLAPLHQPHHLAAIAALCPSSGREHRSGAPGMPFARRHWRDRLK
jgi:hypothetical protein